MNPVLVNAALFQIAWLVTVWGAGNGLIWLGLLSALLVAGIHLSKARRWTREARLLLLIVVLGTGFDSLLLATGWLSYRSGQIIEGVAPLWISSLWICFATTLNVSLRWLRGRTLWMLLLGLVGGPMAYLAGSGLNAVTLHNVTAAVIALGIGWALIVPLLIRLAARYDGWAVDNSRSGGCYA